jgi:hypothetical protein
LAAAEPHDRHVFDEMTPHSLQGYGEFRRVLTPYRFVLLTMMKIGLIATISFGPGNQ